MNVVRAIKTLVPSKLLATSICASRWLSKTIGKQCDAKVLYDLLDYPKLLSLTPTRLFGPKAMNVELTDIVRHWKSPRLAWLIVETTKRRVSLWTTRIGA